MRILPFAMFGLVLLAGCSGGHMAGETPSAQYNAPYAGPAPAVAASPSGSPSGSMSAAPQRDAIDRFAAAYAAEHPTGRY